jgi:hypothetical protein
VSAENAAMDALFDWGRMPEMITEREQLKRVLNEVAA